MSDPLANIPLSTLRIFEAAARRKSFTRAAEELGITQAAVSWQVKSLERRLGQVLFRRLPREVALTPPGERLALATGEAMRMLRASLLDLADTGESVLAISTTQPFATQWLAPRLGAFHLAHPKIAVRVETDSNVVDLARGNIDAAFRSGSGDWPGIESVYLFPCAVTPLCTADFAARHGGLARPEDLAAAPRAGAHEDWAAWFAAAGVAAPRRSAGHHLNTDLQTVGIAAALAGYGVAMCSTILFAADIAQGRLIQPIEAVLTRAAGYWLAYPRDRRRSAKIAALRDWVLATVADDPATARFAGAGARPASDYPSRLAV